MQGKITGTENMISFSLLRCSQFPGSCFVAGEQYPSYSNDY